MSPNQPKANDTVFGFEALPSFEDFLSSWDIAGSTPDSAKIVKKYHEQIYATVSVNHM